MNHPYIITLKRVLDGKIYNICYDSQPIDDPDWTQDAAVALHWTEGNYGCDCNRYLFAERSIGNDPDWDDHEVRPCGHERYELVSIWNMNTGKLVPYNQY
jgi:hypothetical protein